MLNRARGSWGNLKGQEKGMLKHTVRKRQHKVKSGHSQENNTIPCLLSLRINGTYKPHNGHLNGQVKQQLRDFTLKKWDAIFKKLFGM